MYAEDIILVKGNTVTICPAHVNEADVFRVNSSALLCKLVKQWRAKGFNVITLSS